MVALFCKRRCTYWGYLREVRKERSERNTSHVTHTSSSTEEAASERGCSFCNGVVVAVSTSPKRGYENMSVKACLWFVRQATNQSIGTFESRLHTSLAFVTWTILCLFIYFHSFDCINLQHDSHEITWKKWWGRIHLPSSVAEIGKHNKQPPSQISEVTK